MHRRPTRTAADPRSPAGPPAGLAAASTTALNVSLAGPARAAVFEEIPTMLTTRPLHLAVVRAPVRYPARQDVTNPLDLSPYRMTDDMPDPRAVADVQAAT